MSVLLSNLNGADVMSVRKEEQSDKTKGKLVGRIVGLLVFVSLIFWIGNSIFGGNKSDTNKSSTVTSAKKYTISEDKAEKFCQDSNLVGKYIDKGISIIDPFNYGKTYTELGSKAADGSKIMLLMWNGKNLNNDKAVSYLCYISGNNDSINLERLVIDGEHVDGSNNNL